MVRLLDKTPGETAPMSLHVGSEFTTLVCTPNGWYQPFRTVIQFVAVVFLLIATAPILLIAAALVRLTSRGPAFYTQARLGHNGREFTIYKLRSMVVQSEAESGPCWSTKRDPRITIFGRFLRRTHIDELPQLWNIIRGDMSLIGPRPERPEFLAKLEKAIPGYRNRLLVRPGITGLAQVQLPADFNLDDVRKKQAYDLYYITSMNPWLDLRIILCTPLKMCGVPYSLLGRIFAMPCPSHVESTYQLLHAKIRINTEAQVQLA